MQPVDDVRDDDQEMRVDTEHEMLGQIERLTPAQHQHGRADDGEDAE